MTKNIELIERNLFNTYIPLKLVDTPGIFDCENNAYTLIPELITKTEGDLCLMMIVVSIFDRIEPPVLLMINTLRKFLKSDRIVIVFSYCDKMEDSEEYSDQWMKDLNGLLDDNSHITQKLCFYKDTRFLEKL
jgi:GTPase Era involved in 16S rRNA processing